MAMNFFISTDLLLSTSCDDSDIGGCSDAYAICDDCNNCGDCDNCCSCNNLELSHSGQMLLVLKFASTALNVLVLVLITIMETKSIFIRLQLHVAW